MVGIYKIQNNISGKLYIGSSKNIQKRLRSHKSMLRCNNHHSQHLQNSYNKNGVDSFTFCKIENCEPDELLIREQYYFDKLLKADKYVSGKSNYFIEHGYNVLPKAKKGFSGKHKRSSVIKAQRANGFSSIYKINLEGIILKEYDLIVDIKINRTTIWESILNKSCLLGKNYGFIYSKDYYKGYAPILLEVWNKGKTYELENYKGRLIYVYDMYGRFYKKFDSIRDCCKEMNISNKVINSYLNKINSRTRKYLYLTEEKDFNNLVYFEKELKDNTLCIFSIFDEFLGYSTLKKASKILNIHQGSISQVIHNKRIQCKGYKFKNYKDIV